LNNYVLPVITAILLLGLFYVYRKFGYPIVSFFTFAIWILGIVVSIASYGSVSEFWDDLRPELIGLTFDIGLLYILLEFFRRRDEQKEEERKERSTVLVLLSEQLKQILDFISIRYYYCVTGNTTSSVSIEDLKEIIENVDYPFNEKCFSPFITKVPVDDLHLYKAESISDDRIDLDAYAVTVSTFDLLFRVPTQKQIEKFIIMYQRIIPDNLYTLLIDLNKILLVSMYFEEQWVEGKKEVDILELKLILNAIGSKIVKLHEYLNNMKKRFPKEDKFKQSIETKWLHIWLRYVEISSILYSLFQRIRNRKHITKDNDTSTNT
jgi:hypothetical protein